MKNPTHTRATLVTTEQMPLMNNSNVFLYHFFPPLSQENGDDSKSFVQLKVSNIELFLFNLTPFNILVEWVSVTSEHWGSRFTFLRIIETIRNGFETVETQKTRIGKLYPWWWELELKLTKLSVDGAVFHIEFSTLLNDFPKTTRQQPIRKWFMIMCNHK